MKNFFIRGNLNTSASINPFQILKNLKSCSKEDAINDLKAGLSVAMLSFSMGIAYAMIAGLPVKYGLFGGIIAAFVSFVFSSSRFIMFGPSNASAVMLMSAFASMGLETEAQRVAAASAVVFFVGLFLIVASFLKITNFVRYVSRTVITGYITAGGLLIIANQLNSALGIQEIEKSSPNLFGELSQTLSAIGDCNVQAISVCALTLAILFACKIFFKKLPAQAIALILAATICAIFGKFHDLDLSYIASVSVSDWSFTPPDFKQVPLRQLAISSLAVALFCVIESTSIGKSMAAKNAERLNSNQEMFSLGIANMLASLFSSTVESGSLTRSAAANDAGARTVFINLFSGIFMLLGVFVFGSYIGYIPSASLSAVVIVIAFSLFSRKALRLALRSTWEDALVFWLTFITGVVSSLDDAVYAGVCASIILFLKKASAPEVMEVAIGDDGEERKLKDPAQKRDPEISIVHVGGNLFFGASDVFQDQVRRICQSPSIKVLILKLRSAINFDASSAADIDELASQMRERGGVLYLCEVSPEIMKVLKSSKVAKSVGEENIFAYTDENPTLSTAYALKAAKKFLKGGRAEVEIYV